jgi:hypothetical protein
MDQEFLEWFGIQLSHRNARVASGLTDSEITSIQSKYEFIFPPDLRCLLQHSLPVYEPEPNNAIPRPKSSLQRWIDWRHGAEETIRLHLTWPLRSIGHDIECNGFWHDEWGIRPPDPLEARSIAEQHILTAPPLIPVYGHRYLAGVPILSGNPIYSIWYTDIIRYGDDLASYFRNEFLGWQSPTRYQITSQPPDEFSKTGRYIPFWDDLVRRNRGS